MSAIAPASLRLVPRRTTVEGGTTSNIFSVDVEEWFQVGAFENTLGRDQWHSLESRVEQQTEFVLELLAQAQVLGTFFCLGWVAERFPKLISMIATAGHEVGCHGMDHRRIFTMSPAEFFDDVTRAKSLLEEAGGKPVRGYRAPSFSMTAECWEFYEKLEEAGFSYSSSIVPAKTDHYGAVGLPRTPFFPLKNCSVIEIPMTVATFGQTAFPASGGGYFRLLPMFLSTWLMNRARRQTGIGTVFYMHPWETDPDQPFISNAPLRSRLRHYTGLAAMSGKVKNLLASSTFGRVDTVVAQSFEWDADQ